MREQRVEDAVLYVKFPKNPRKKTVKIGLYLASQFESNGLINIKGKTFPPAPLRKDKRDEYWNREHYRLMINDKWLRPKAQYTFYSIDQVFEIAKEALSE